MRLLPEAAPVPVRRFSTANESVAPDLAEPADSYAYFRREWLSRHGLVADRCSVIRVMGESMEPTLPAGCAVLLDHKQRRRWEGRIFAIGMSGGWVIRRAGKDEAGNWLLMCDHPARGPEPWSNAEIIGEVRWMAREV